MDLASCELSSVVGLLGLCLWFPTIYAHGAWSNWYVVELCELCKPNNTPASFCALSYLTSRSPPPIGVRSSSQANPGARRRSFPPFPLLLAPITNHELNNDQQNPG